LAVVTERVEVELLVAEAPAARRRGVDEYLHGNLVAPGEHV